VRGLVIFQCLITDDTFLCCRISFNRLLFKETHLS